MYWLLPQNEQEAIREKITTLAMDLARITNRVQNDQVFPFAGRKDRRTARAIIHHLVDGEDSIICDPFGGSGIFAYAALDERKRILFNEWEPFAYRMSTAPFREIPNEDEINTSLSLLDAAIGPLLNHLYKTICPQCGNEHVLDGLFYDRDPQEYFTPTAHERIGANGENIIFRNSYRCACGTTQKIFDDSDEEHMQWINRQTVNFPNPELIENSRINFTAPTFIWYQALFP